MFVCGICNKAIKESEAVEDEKCGVKCKECAGIIEDSVNHPSHYTGHPSGIECIEITQHYDFCIGNAIKYLWRAGLKTEEGMSDSEKEIEDLKKALWYINRKIKMLKGGAAWIA